MDARVHQLDAVRPHIIKTAQRVERQRIRWIRAVTVHIARHCRSIAAVYGYIFWRCGGIRTGSEEISRKIQDTPRRMQNIRTVCEEIVCVSGGTRVAMANIGDARVHSCSVSGNIATQILYIRRVSAGILRFCLDTWAMMEETSSTRGHIGSPRMDISSGIASIQTKCEGIRNASTDIRESIDHIVALWGLIHLRRAGISRRRGDIPERRRDIAGARALTAS